jgi:hypothetical protein
MSEIGVAVRLPAGVVVRDVIAALGIPEKSTESSSATTRIWTSRAPLQDGFELSLFPPSAGGAF